MIDNEEQYIWPGPFITEKTLKCLLGGTAFIPIGQFETYQTLQNLGLQFDYNFDTTWDLDPGNLSRAESIINLIDDLNQYSPTELASKTWDSSRHNQNYILNGDFCKHCQTINLNTIDKIYTIL
jgi:hypothetical protein